MMVNQALLGVLAGSILTIAGTWIGARWQANEARRVRQEQYARDDYLRDQNLRRELYARFVQCADEGITAGIGVALKREDDRRALPKIVGKLALLCMEIELYGTPRVVAAAHYIIDAVDDAAKDSDEVNAAAEIFLREARRELGLSTQNLPMASFEWIRKRNRIDWKEIVENLDDLDKK